MNAPPDEKLLAAGTVPPEPPTAGTFPVAAGTAPVTPAVCVGPLGDRSAASVLRNIATFARRAATARRKSATGSATASASGRGRDELAAGGGAAAVTAPTAGAGAWRMVQVVTPVKAAAAAGAISAAADHLAGYRSVIAVRLSRFRAVVLAGGRAGWAARPARPRRRVGRRCRRWHRSHRNCGRRGKSGQRGDRNTRRDGRCTRRQGSALRRFVPPAGGTPVARRSCRYLGGRNGNGGRHLGSCGALCTQCPDIVIELRSLAAKDGGLPSEPLAFALARSGRLHGIGDGRRKRRIGARRTLPAGRRSDGSYRCHGAAQRPAGGGERQHDAWDTFHDHIRRSGRERMAVHRPDDGRRYQLRPASSGFTRTAAPGLPKGSGRPMFTPPPGKSIEDRWMHPARI